MTQDQCPPSICFVTNELYPLRKGGIGRMLYNFARQNAVAGFPAEIHFLVPPDLVATSEDETRLRGALDGLATIHVAVPLHQLPDTEAHLFDRASFTPWSLGLLVSTSYRYYRALLMIQQDRGAPFDFIEFPDFGGWGLASIEAKRAGTAFQSTVLAARLHSTQGMIARAERFFDPSEWSGVLMDSERHLLSHADLIVGHVQSIIDANAAHYDLRDRWQGRTVLEFPPILLEEAELRPAIEVPPSDVHDFIFSSRLQPFKRPDIFIRAAIGFLEKHPDHAGVFRLVSYGWDRSYIDWLQRLVPASLADRILFITDATETQRSAYLARSIVVVPSDFESLCLFAYEAGQLGRPVLLNARCAAFGDNPRWRDGENCLLFDGTAAALVAAMERALNWQPTDTVSVAVDAPYWVNPAHRAPASPAPDPGTRASISVVFTGIVERADFRVHLMRAAFLEAALDIGGRDELVVLLPHGLFAPDAPEIAALTARGWTVMWTPEGEECPEAFGARLAALGGDCVMVYPLGYDIDSDYVLDGLRTMHLQPDLAIFGAHVAVDDTESGQLDALRAYGGEMPSHALTTSRIAPVPSLMRRSLLARRQFDPRAGKFWFDVFLRDCAIDGEPILIAPRLAANLSGPAALTAGTTGKVTAGVMDRAGLRAGLSARLLAFDTGQESEDFHSDVHVIAGNALAAAGRLRPTHPPYDWNPVQFVPAHDGLMVHPLQASPLTIAALSMPPGRFRHVVARIRNVNDQNDGVEAAVACVPQGLDDNWVLSVLEGRIGDPRRFPMSNWTPLGIGQADALSLSVQGVGPGARLFLMARLPENAREHMAQLVFERIALS
jgi:glycosyltransferase involved in cell wall biosynthesis